MNLLLGFSEDAGKNFFRGTIANSLYFMCHEFELLHCALHSNWLQWQSKISYYIKLLWFLVASVKSIARQGFQRVWKFECKVKCFLKVFTEIQAAGCHASFLMYEVGHGHVSAVFSHLTEMDQTVPRASCKFCCILV